MRPAVGYLVGDVHNGIAQMFKVIEAARMMVGTKSAGALSAGYLQALNYARSRIQGADLTRAADKTAPRVTIIHHPDVRRSLMLQKAYAEGLRALYMYAGALLDADVAAHAFDLDAETASRVNDFLLPVVKGVGSERSYEMLTESLQTLGGSGYLQDYPIESNTFATSRSTRSTKERRRPKPWTSSSAEQPVDDDNVVSRCGRGEIGMPDVDLSGHNTIQGTFRFHTRRDDNSPMRLAHTAFQRKTTLYVRWLARRVRQFASESPCRAG